ncbi:hypothetical protein [Streptomyces viridochromogenes]|uniref:Uncharacterized protein n=1 Tax=Streptomyces viridochromogenes Tue57 TaxID=1160705 RepID=L8PHG7_STRVR|nr:hypothetical protein [Streptomyces viridochromogenes]ELS55629.1 hypothetical protein STVIR_3418 [Streptomyces viridochromogenes Tue57]
MRIAATAETARAPVERGLREEARGLLTAQPTTVGGDARGGTAAETALALVEVRHGWSAVGEPERARASADRAPRVCGVSEELTVGWRMVRALLRAGLRERAAWFVRRLPPGDAHASARDALAQCLAEQGEPAAALNWARPLLYDDGALLDAALTLVRVRTPSPACRTSNPLP